MLADPGGGPAWFCYEDMGYKHIPGLLAWRISKLFRARVWPTPAAVPVTVDHPRKLAAVACYPTQVAALEAEWAIRTKLDAPAPEQYWRLATPPAGWEVLTDL
jgi:LmbE family N-acetylglucosaminyl deacetylase